MKYLIYAAVAVLVLWAVYYLVQHFRRQLKGGCDGNCDSCGCGKCKGH